MNIVLIGATGAIGSRILDEALRRGHKVTAVTRDPKKVEPRPGMIVGFGSTTDGPALMQVIKGHDVAVVSVKWNDNDIRRVIDTIRRSGVKRCLWSSTRRLFVGSTSFGGRPKRSVKPNRRRLKNSYPSICGPRCRGVTERSRGC